MEQKSKGLDRLVISPAIWPGKKELSVQPGDLSKFAPYGNGVYGYQRKNPLEPIRGDPSQGEGGGLVYFGNGAKKKKILMDF